MKDVTFGILTAALLGICQMAGADALLIDAYASADPADTSAWVNAGITQDISGGAGGTSHNNGNTYNCLNLDITVAGLAGGASGGVPGNNMLNDYHYSKNGTASVSIGGLVDEFGAANTLTSSLGGMAGNTFTLQANQDYVLYLFGIGDTTGQNTAFTFDGVTKTTSGDTAGAEDSHFVTYEFSTGADLTGYTVDFTYTGDTTIYGAWNGAAIVAIPEPATLGLLAAFGGGMLLIRRRFMI